MSQPNFTVITSTSTYHEETKSVQADTFNEIMKQEGEDLDWTQSSVDTVVGMKWREDNSGTEKIVIIKREK